MAAQTTVLNNGVKIPVLGLGTWQGGVSNLKSSDRFYAFKEN